MKTIFIKKSPTWQLTLFLVFLLTLNACKDDIKESSGYIHVSPTEISNVDKNGQEEIIDIKSNCYWSVRTIAEDGTSASWITPSTTKGMSDMSLTLSFAKNTNPVSLHSYFIISSAV